MKVVTLMRSADLMGNKLSSIFSLATEFPGPLDLSKLAESGGIFPEVPIHILQKVATDRCAVPPLEVTEELLLATPNEPCQTEGSSSLDKQLVIHGQ